MVLYFLRHADAEPDADSDFDRKLTPKGLEQADKVAKFLLHNGLVPDIILSSPVIRAKQTAAIVAKKLEMPKPKEVDWLACGMAAETCRREIRPYKEKGALMLVGHEPDFSGAIAALLGVGDADALNIRKASLTAVDLPDFKLGSGHLQFLIPVRLM